MSARSIRFAASFLVAGVLMLALPVAHGVAAAPQQLIYHSLNSPAGLWRINADGSGLPQPFIAGADWPDYSADGSKLVYQVGGDAVCNVNFGPGQIIVANANGSNPVTIGSGCQPRISPDGTKVLYFQIANGSPAALIVASVSNPNSPHQPLGPVSTCITNVNGAYGGYPDQEFGDTKPGDLVCTEPEIADWIDNNNIVFGAFNIGVWALPASGGTPHPLITGGGAAVQDSDWFEGLEVSPNGATIAGHFTPGSGTLATGVATLPVSGGGPAVIFADPGGSNNEVYAYPQWSASGQQLALTHFVTRGVDRIAVMSASGGHPTDIHPSDGTAQFPTFGPPPNTHKLTISTVNDQFRAIPNENVHLVGPGLDTTISTGPSGTVTLDEAPGNYTVQAISADGPFKALRSPDCTVQRVACSVNLDQDRSVTFQAAQDQLEFHFSPSSLAADGLKAYTGEVDDLDPSGSPVSGVSIKFTPPVESPKALVCSATGLLYPQLLGSSIAFHPFRSITDGSGQVHFTVHLGTEPGSWLLDALELNRLVPATGSIDLPFTAVPRRLRADIAQRIYDILLTLPTGTRQEILHLSGAPAADQAVLLAFLQMQLGELPDFGPIHTGSRAAVEFYDATGATAVLDTQIADEIADAALNRAPLPANAIHLPTLSEYEATVGPTNRGTLTPQPDGELLYFGFPYPTLTQTGEADAAFYDQCLKPDALYFHVEVHSPVRLLFTDSHGRRFGLTASGKAARGGAGLMLTDRAHHTTTFVLPAAAYRVALSGTGSGGATIVAFTAGRRRMRGQVVSFPVRRGQVGSAALGFGGLGTTVKFGGHRYRVLTGLGLRIRLAAARIRHGHGSKTVKIVVTDQFGRVIPSAEVTVVRGRSALATALTNSRGAATLLVPRSKKGHLSVRVAAPATRAASATLTIF